MSRWLSVTLLSLCLLFSKGFAKVYDCFLFFNEYEVVDIRFHELYDHVDYFVVVEACEGFTGKPKPFNFESHLHRYAPFLDKIIYVRLCEPQVFDTAWEREKWQRNQIMQGLGNCELDDVIFISDCDEIIEGKHVNEAMEALKAHKLVTFRPSIWSWYCLNRVIHSANCPNKSYAEDLVKLDQFMQDPSKRGLGICCSTVGLYYKDLLPWSPQVIRENVRSFQTDGTASNYPYPITYYKCSGWHFSSTGGVSAVMEKFANWSHFGDAIGHYNQIQQGSKEWEYQQWREKVDKYQLDVIDEHYPQYVQDNVEHFIDIGLVDPY